MVKQTSDEIKVGDTVEPIKEGWNETFVVKGFIEGFNNEKHLRSAVFEEGGFYMLSLLRKVN